MWLKLCWGKDMDHEKMEYLRNTKQTSMSDCSQIAEKQEPMSAINRKWIDWSRRKSRTPFREGTPYREGFIKSFLVSREISNAF